MSHPLDSFDPKVRREELERLAAAEAAPEPGPDVNMHFHSFFSYNAEGWSPSRIAWESRQRGLLASGLCDFDVLDGLEEFLAAGRLLGLRTSVAVETRAYVQELAEVDINSPGEAGVAYIMGAGFTSVPDAGTPQAEGLERLRNGARDRNLELVARINPHVPEIAIDYEADVVPLTPGGAATERHIIRAYTNAAAAAFAGDALAAFWARILQVELDMAEALVADIPALEEKVRSRFAKRGGFGYVQPTPDSFPPVDEFVAWVESCGAIPMAAWLDGASGGERDPKALLGLLHAKGCVALNIVPDRNWNFSDPAVKAEKVAALDAIVAVAEELGMPINIGTEMNKGGLPFADDLTGEVLSKHREVFERGAMIMVGHTVLARYAGFGYCSNAAMAAFAGVAEKNRFFEAVGRLPGLTEAQATELEALENDAALRVLSRAAAGIEELA